MKPKIVSNAEITFGKVGGLLPSMGEIPEEFKRSGNPWVRWQQRWFFEGLKTMPSPKDGIVLSVAMRHLSAIQQSFQPKHEHKEAGVAYLASLWFKDDGSTEEAGEAK